jgi:hypothetical protein
VVSGVAEVSRQGSGHDRSSVMTEILRYLVAHPDAKDTVEGIARWWIAPRGDERWNRDAVQEAIDALLARGWMVRRETTPSHAVYGLDKQHLSAITRVISDEE